ncbi:MAG: FAD-dependent oxidoreductase [Eggerthellaceae bacterium]|nr:FAD-dependent oxidoreductase [Eggerthellaceae bacterium]
MTNTLEASNVRVPLDAMLPENEARLRGEVARALGVKPRQVRAQRLLKRSVDARKKANVHFVTTWVVDLAEGVAPKPRKGVNVKAHVPPEPLRIPDCRARLELHAEPRPVVVGAGPAGLFATLYLAQAGLRPLLVERGEAVEDRARTVEAFNAGAPLNVNSNVQFGEGGAGTFSDGKLNTGTKSPHIRHVLEAFVEAGAPSEILVDAKPHIGTDKLAGVVRNLRRRIEDAGGEVRFNTQLSGLDVEDGAVSAVRLCDVLTGEERTVRARRVVLACGHSARDTFEMLRDAGFPMQRKPFAVGVRIEHPQALINRAQYGKAAEHAALGAADYKLAVHLADGRGVYTFCMCPGGEVVAAASEEGGVCTNGMSRHARDGEAANSALLAEVRACDLPGDDPLEGVAFQRALERAAFEAARAAGGAPYAAPAQTVGAFLAAEGGALDAGEGDATGGESGARGGAEGRRLPVLKQSWARAKAPLALSARAELRAGSPLPPAPEADCDSSSKTSMSDQPLVAPTYPRGVAWVDLHACLPPLVTDALAEALPLLDAKMSGFAHPQAVMTAVEARSSSPVRIVRDDTFQSSIRGLYPCGEGAGYAGGIMSAAVDGLRVAEAICNE